MKGVKVNFLSEVETKQDRSAYMWVTYSSRIPKKF